MSNTLFSTTLTSATCGACGTTSSTLNETGRDLLAATGISATCAATGISATTASAISPWAHAPLAMECAEEYVESLSDEELEKLIALTDDKLVELTCDSENEVAKVKTLK